MLVASPNRVGSQLVVPKQRGVDVQILGVVEDVNEICPELKTGRPNETDGFRHSKVPLVTAGQSKGRDGRRSIFTRW